MEEQEYLPFSYLIFVGLFIGSLIMAVICGSKLVEIGPFLFDGGALIYASTFIITDIVSEVFGKKHAVRIAQAGFFAMIAAFVMTQVAFMLPASSEWELAQEFNAILGMGSRVFVAALISYSISQYADLTIFAWLRQKTEGRHLWLRNNLSTVAGGGLDAIIFSTIAFYGIYPLLPIVTTAFIVRILFSIADTPFVYLAVHVLKGRS